MIKIIIAIGILASILNTWIENDLLLAKIGTTLLLVSFLANLNKLYE